MFRGARLRSRAAFLHPELPGSQAGTIALGERRRPSRRGQLQVRSAVRARTPARQGLGPRSRRGGRRLECERHADVPERVSDRDRHDQRQPSRRDAAAEPDRRTVHVRAGQGPARQLLQYRRLLSPGSRYLWLGAAHAQLPDTRHFQLGPRSGQTLPVREGHSVEFRLEAFNALNGVVFGAPNASYGGTAFGQINGYAGGFGARKSSSPFATIIDATGSILPQTDPEWEKIHAASVLGTAERAFAAIRTPFSQTASFAGDAHASVPQAVINTVGEPVCRGAKRYGESRGHLSRKTCKVP